MVSGLAVGWLWACGPDPKPEEPCNGPTFNLLVRADGGPLPSDTRINVRYGANQDGEPYALGKAGPAQAVHCTEDTSPGGQPSTTDDQDDAGNAGQGGSGNEPVWKLRCLLYTQGPAHLDVTASGYAPVKDEPLSLDGKHRCEVPERFTLTPVPPKVEP